MDASRKTKIVAEGIALWAAYQDLPMSRQNGSPEEGAWLEWADRYTPLTDIAQREQSRLFDLILHS